VGPYRIEWKTGAAKYFSNLPRQIQERIAVKVDALAQNPHPIGSKKLTHDDNLHRIRVGVYRIVYQVRNEVLLILVIKVGLRKDVYRNL